MCRQGCRCFRHRQQIGVSPVSPAPAAATRSVHDVEAGATTQASRSWASSLAALRFTGKIRKHWLRRGKTESEPPPPPNKAVGIVNELAALSDRSERDEVYLQELQRANHTHLLTFADPLVEGKYGAFILREWTMAALRNRLLKFMGVFAFFGIFGDIISSVRDPTTPARLAAYGVIFAIMAMGIGLTHVLDGVERSHGDHRERTSTASNDQGSSDYYLSQSLAFCGGLLRPVLHVGVTLLWSLCLLGMAVRFVDIRYLSALLLPLLYPHSLLHFRWLLALYGTVAIVFELSWVFLLDGWRSLPLVVADSATATTAESQYFASNASAMNEYGDTHSSYTQDTADEASGHSSLYTRGHSLHGVLLVASTLFLFVKYVHERETRGHFKLVEVIELRKQQLMRGQTVG